MIIVFLQTLVVIPNQSEMHQPFDIAIDPYSRTIYWTCTNQNVINITRLDMTAVGVVVSGENEKPRSIVLNPLNGYDSLSGL